MVDCLLKRNSSSLWQGDVGEEPRKLGPLHLAVPNDLSLTLQCRPLKSLGDFQRETRNKPVLLTTWKMRLAAALWGGKSLRAGQPIAFCGLEHLSAAGRL